MSERKYIETALLIVQIIINNYCVALILFAQLFYKSFGIIID
jgi:hypothetical protein